MTKTSMEAVVRQRWSDVSATLDERRRRVWAATEARAWGRGGVSLLARVTGLSRPTIYAGLKELADGVASLLPVERVRRRGGGRQPITQTQPGGSVVVINHPSMRLWSPGLAAFLSFFLPVLG